MRRLYFLICGSALLAQIDISAQSAGCVTYTAADGLGAGNCQDFFQDSQGYLWVGTYNSGVSRFDGKNWKTWDINSGLSQNIVTHIYEDKEGAIWLDHGEADASRLVLDKSQQVQNFSYIFTNQRLRFDYVTLTPFTLPLESSKRFSFDYSTNKFESEGKDMLPNDWSQHYHKAVFHAQTMQGQYIWTAIEKRTHKIDVLVAEVQNPANVTRIGNLPNEYEFASVLACGDGHLVMIDQQKQRVLLLRNNILQTLNAPSLPGFAGDFPALEAVELTSNPLTQTLLVVWRLKEAVKGKARYLLADYNLSDLQLQQTLLFSTGQKVAHCFKDRAGTYWVSTDANVMRLFPEHFYIPTDAPGMVPSVWAVAEAADGKVWFSSNGFGLTCFDGLNMSQPWSILDTKATFYNGSLADEYGNMFFNAENIQHGNRSSRGLFKFDGTHYEILAPGTLGFFLGYDRQHRLMRGMNQQGLWILPNGSDGRDTTHWIKINRSKGLLLGNVITAVEDQYGRYWMGRTSKGLACYDTTRDTVFNWIKNDDKSHYGAMSMEMDLRGNIWIGTDHGLCFMETPSRMDGHFNPLKSLRRVALDYTGESTVTTLKLIDSRTLLFGNEKGFYLLNLDAYYANPQRIIVHTFNQKNGNSIGGMEQNAAIITREKQIWLLGTNGALRFDPRLARIDTLTAKIQIDSICTDVKTFTEFSNLFNVGSGAQRLRIFFQHDLNPLLLDNIRYRYRLTGDSNWSALREIPYVEFSRLAPGSYGFEVLAEKDGMRSLPALVKFRIAPIWWQNPWVWLAALIIVVGTAIFLRDKERKFARQKIQLEKSKTAMAIVSKEKDKLQVQAIVNQLNPHFINNALHWLQVRMDEDKEAVSVVAKLSENIATVFKNSRQKKPYHTLHEEMKLVQNYLFIQKCRFRDRLRYLIPSVESFKTLEVPLMIVQIHVENAVEHGIRKKTDGYGLVSVALDDERDSVCITVTDDGIGRKAAREFPSHGTQNGVLMLLELTAIYNRLNRFHITQSYEDGVFTNQEGKLYGTRVIIRIPKIYRYDI